MKRFTILLSCLPLIVSGQNYRLVNANSGLVLDTPGSGDGSILQQWNWAGRTNQEWQLTPIGNGYYKIISVQSGRVLDVQGASTADGAPVQIYDWLGTLNQQWSVAPQGSSYASIINRGSGKVLDVTNLSTTNGANIQQWDWLTGLNQQWQPEPIQTNYNTSVQTNITYNSTAGLVNVITTVDWDYNSEYYYSSHVVNTNTVNGVYRNSNVTDVQGFDTLTYSLALNPGDYLQVNSHVTNQELYTVSQAGQGCTSSCNYYYDPYDYSFIAGSGEGEDRPDFNGVVWIVPIIVAQRTATKILGSSQSGSSYTVPGPKNIFDIKLRQFIPAAFVLGAAR
ncbi:MAG: RICIN domain-containing protein [Acidobacteriota bacterium]|nr:RICIN domain-containing protein [Acidobacteriota bacterium]